MAVNELDRDFLRMQHQADMINEIMSGVKMVGDPDANRKSHVGNLVRYLEMELIDSKWVDGGKDMTAIQATATAGRTYWLG